ncbi:MAG: molybdopterin molybdotransferase MoeA [Actinomycetota bacterium]|nr:molybdopterin molybdotransferase MoeA [Actinomycetota bacterium]
MPGLLSIEDALAHVLARAQPLEVESVLLADCRGRVLLEEARAAVDLPPFASSAMDGYAVRAADTPGRLELVGRVAAGRPAGRSLEQGQAMGIATGGAVPDGADAVVPIELVVDTDNGIHIEASAKAGDHVRPVGGDVLEGAAILEAGTRLGPAQLGAAAAAGVASLRCARRPRVTVLSTGTELRRPGAELGPGEIYESNSVMLVAALAVEGAEVDVLDSVADDPGAHRAAIEHGLAGDLLVTSGGVSVGPHDLVRSVERELGVEEVFWRVAVKPGKPVAFGTRGRTLVFGLPGNPVSALVGFELFVRPALRGLQGERSPGPRYAYGSLGAPLRRNGARDELVRARTRTGGTEVVLDPVAGQDSHMIVRAAAADALVLVPLGVGELGAGERVRYLPLG